MVLRDRYLPVRSRCLHPGQQQGRRWPSSSSSWVRRMRRSRVLACLASSTQQMNSLRAKGVMFLPDIECRGVGDQRLTQVRGQLMHHPTGQSAAAHRPMVLSRRQAGSPPACGTPSRRTLPPRGTCFRRPTSMRRRSRADLVCAEGGYLSISGRMGRCLRSWAGTIRAPTGSCWPGSLTMTGAGTTWTGCGGARGGVAPRAGAGGAGCWLTGGASARSVDGRHQ